MSYNFGQLRRKQIKSYLTNINYQLSTITVPSTDSQSIVYKDQILQLEEPLNSVDEMGKQRSYYLRFKIYRKTSSNQLITLKLKNESKEQIIKSFSIAAGSETECETFEVIISPKNNTYSQIVFELERTAEDVAQVNEDGTYGRTVTIEIDKLASIFNVISFLNSSIENKGKLKQIGVQGPAGLLMCINGESIYIGRTGIYEINYGISISSIGFVVEPDDNKNFIMDYQY